MLASVIDEPVEQLATVGDERRLIEEAQRDPAAMTRLYRLHCDAIHGYVLRRVGNDHDADDLTAEVFLLMVRSLPRYRWRGVPFRAWLYRLATNEVNRWAQRRRRSAIRQVRAQTIDDLSTDEAADPTAEAEYLQAALLSLPSRFQTVLSLFYLEDMPIADIAQVLSCRTGTIKSRLSRGRDALRKLLERRRGDL